MKKVTKYVNITEKDIKNMADDYWFVVDPMWEKGDIYQTYDIYEKSLSEFTSFQKYLHAVVWLVAEVNNGGFDQLFFNSTGIVWNNACKGFEVMGIYEVVDILKKVEILYGKSPSFVRQERWNEMEHNTKWHQEIDELDSEFYALEDFDSKIVEYIKGNASQFLFEGEIEVVE